MMNTKHAIRALEPVFTAAVMFLLMACAAFGQAADEHAEHHPEMAATESAESPATQPASASPAAPMQMMGSGGMDCCQGMMGSGKGGHGMMSGMGSGGDKPGASSAGRRRSGMMTRNQKPGSMMAGNEMPMHKMMEGMKKKTDASSKMDRGAMHRMHEMHGDDMLGRPPMMMKMGKGGMAGVPHPYHIAAKDFLLDRTDLGLTAEQKAKLMQLREDCQLSMATHHRKVEQAEQELWVLTGKTKPDAAAVEAKLNEIAGLHTAGRLAYFNAVHQAVSALTDEQRAKLTQPAS